MISSIFNDNACAEAWFIQMRRTAQTVVVQDVWLSQIKSFILTEWMSKHLCGHKLRPHSKTTRKYLCPWRSGECGSSSPSCRSWGGELHDCLRVRLRFPWRSWVVRRRAAEMRGSWGEGPRSWTGASAERPWRSRAAPRGRTSAAESLWHCTGNKQHTMRKEFLVWLRLRQKKTDDIKKTTKTPVFWQQISSGLWAVFRTQQQKRPIVWQKIDAQSLGPGAQFQCFSCHDFRRHNYFVMRWQKNSYSFPSNVWSFFTRKFCSRVRVLNSSQSQVRTLPACQHEKLLVPTPLHEVHTRISCVDPFETYTGRKDIVSETGEWNVSSTTANSRADELSHENASGIEVQLTKPFVVSTDVSGSKHWDTELLRVEQINVISAEKWNPRVTDAVNWMTTNCPYWFLMTQWDLRISEISDRRSSLNRLRSVLSCKFIHVLTCTTSGSTFVIWVALSLGQVGEETSLCLFFSAGRKLGQRPSNKATPCEIVHCTKWTQLKAVKWERFEPNVPTSLIVLSPFACLWRKAPHADFAFSGNPLCYKRHGKCQTENIVVKWL